MSGLEVVGAIASVVQLAQVVYEISKSLYEVGNALANASSDILDLAHDLEIFSEELQLHATLVTSANHRYSDQVNRLTAKIIGRCATICRKIDRILKKLRTGGVWAKVKWLYKEKEIKKLLERLRDLKLSLMGTLSHLRSLKADYMMDALGVANSSLLKAEDGEETSKETMEDIKDTRRTLAELSVGQKLGDSTVCRVQSCGRSSSWMKTACTDNGLRSQRPRNDVLLQSSSTPFGSVVSLHPETTKLVNSPFISTICSSAQPGISHIMGNLRALESVQSFYSALSYQPDNDQYVAKKVFFPQRSDEEERFGTSQSADWMAEMVGLAIKHFSMSQEQARTWALSLPNPTKWMTCPDDPAGTFISEMQGTECQIELGDGAEDWADNFDAGSLEQWDVPSTTAKGENFPEMTPTLGSDFVDAFINSFGPDELYGPVDLAQPLSEVQFRLKPFRDIFMNLVEEQDTGPHTERAMAQMDIFDFPPVLRADAAMPQAIPPAIKKWGQLKQWVALNPGLGPESLHSIKTLQRLHFQEMGRSKNSQSLAGQMSLGIAGCQIGTPAASPSMAAPAAPTPQLTDMHNPTSDGNMTTQEDDDFTTYDEYNQINFSEHPSEMDMTYPGNMQIDYSPISGLASSHSPYTSNTLAGQENFSDQFQNFQNTGSDFNLFGGDANAQIPAASHEIFQTGFMPGKSFKKIPPRDFSEEQRRLQQNLGLDRQHIMAQIDPVEDKNANVYQCHFKTCPYRSKREYKCRQHMENVHGWAYVRSKNNGTDKQGANSNTNVSGPSTPQTNRVKMRRPGIDVETVGPRKRTEFNSELGIGHSSLCENQQNCFRNFHPGPNGSDYALGLPDGNSFPRETQMEQLWWRAFSKMRHENSTSYNPLLTAWNSSRRASETGLDADIARRAVEGLQNLRNIDTQFRSSVTLGSSSGVGSLGQILEILSVVRSTIGFKIGAFAWTCFCAAFKSQLIGKTIHEISEQQAIFSALANVATLIARYTVMENMYQNWPGMSLEPDYEDSLLSLCIQVLNFLEKALSSRDPLYPMAWTVAEEMAKINKADAVCRAFKVTILQDQSAQSMDDISEEDSDPEGTLQESPNMKRRIEDISAEEPDLGSTEIGYIQDQGVIEEFTSSKRVKV